VQTRVEGRVTSLSAGGLAVILNTSIPSEAVLRMPLKLPGEKGVTVHVQVVDCEPLGNGRWRARGPFLGISEETADQIARHVMQRQQLLLASYSEEQGA